MNLLVTYSEPKDAVMLLDMGRYIHEAHAASCLETPARPPFRMTILTVIHNEKERAEAEASQKRALAIVKDRIPGVQLKIRVGKPEVEIVSEALDETDARYDMVLMGIHPAAKMLRSLVTSTTEKVARRMQLPLVVVRGETRPLRRILICDSGMERQPLAGQVAAALPELFHSGMDITLLHVMSQIGAWPGVNGWQLRADAETLMNAQTPEGQILQRDLELLEGTNIRPHLKVRHGPVMDEIMAECRCGCYDLLIIGAHEGGEAAALLLEDLSKEILLSAPCPVCVVHRIQLKTRQA